VRKRSGRRVEDTQYGSLRGWLTLGTPGSRWVASPRNASDTEPWAAYVRIGPGSGDSESSPPPQVVISRRIADPALRQAPPKVGVHIAATPESRLVDRRAEGMRFRGWLSRVYELAVVLLGMSGQRDLQKRCSLPSAAGLAAWLPVMLRVPPEQPRQPAGCFYLPVTPVRVGELGPREG